MTIKKCDTCKPHPFQDKKYGPQMRVMNPIAPKTPGKHRCTVCDKETVVL